MLIAFVSIVFFLITGLILPISIIHGNLSWDVLIFFVITSYAAFRLSSLINKKEPQLLELSFYIFVYMFMGITPLAQVYYNKFPLLGIPTKREIFFGGLIVVTGIVAYELGLYLGKRKTINENQLNMKTAKNFKFLLYFSLAGFIYATSKSGGISNLFLSRSELNSISSGSISLVITNTLLRIPILVSLLFALIKWRNKDNKNINLKSNVKHQMVIYLLFVINIIASNPFASARFWLGTVILSTIFVLIKWEKKTIAFVTVFFFLIMMFVFPYSDIFRHSTENVSFKIGDLTTTLTEDGDLDAFQQLLNTITVTKYQGFSYGKQLMGAVLFWVPRFLWPGKPIGTGEMVAIESGYNFTNLSAPLWAEFYVNFGIIGVFLLFTLYGYATTQLQIRYIISVKNGVDNFYTVFVPIYAPYQIFLVRGELLGTIPSIAASIFFILLGMKRIHIRERKWLSYKYFY